MSKILGLDLGTNSIGWALIDEATKQIIGTGVRIFPEGINRDTKGSEVSKNATRREKRQTRRQFFRQGLRKQKLVKILMPLAMFPKLDDIQNELQQLKLRADLREFFLMNPYELRAKGVTNDKLTLLELGRVFYHLSQRRGYRENLQADLQEDGTLNKGNADEGKIGIDATKEGMGSGTLGQYLAQLDPHEVRLRNRYTLRSMYIDEFNRIFDAQQKHYPTILTEDFKKQLGEPNKGVIFYQRELRNQRFLRGQCTFEPKKTRIATSSPWFEAFRLFQFMNTVRNGERLLNLDERLSMIELFLKKEKFNFEDFKKAIKNIDTSWNYEDRHTIPGSKTIGAIIKAFNRKDIIDSFKTLNEITIVKELNWLEEIWHIKQFAKDPEWFMKYAKENWKLDEKKAEAFKKFRLAKDFGSVSHKVIYNALPYLIKGLHYNEAIIMGGVRNAFGKNWNSMSAADKDLVEDNVIANAYTDSEEFAITKVKKVLIEGFGLTDADCKKLYHHSDKRQNTKTGNTNVVKAVQSIKNPIVQAALFEVSGLVPQIIEQYNNLEK